MFGPLVVRRSGVLVCWFSKEFGASLGRFNVVVFVCQW